MKKQILFAIGAALLVSIQSAVAQAVVQERTTTTTVQPIEIAGTVTEFAPDTVVIRSEGVAAPVRYSFSNTTEYVDDAGNRVTREIVKTGAPVTLRYVRDGDRLIVSRVIVHQAAPVAPEATTTQKTTTTTTTTEDRKEKREHDKDRDKDHDKDRQ